MKAVDGLGNWAKQWNKWKHVKFLSVQRSMITMPYVDESSLLVQNTILHAKLLLHSVRLVPNFRACNLYFILFVLLFLEHCHLSIDQALHARERSRPEKYRRRLSMQLLP